MNFIKRRLKEELYCETSSIGALLHELCYKPLPDELYCKNCTMETLLREL